jgi:hypothetical protein
MVESGCYPHFGQTCSARNSQIVSQAGRGADQRAHAAARGRAGTATTAHPRNVPCAHARYAPKSPNVYKSCLVNSDCDGSLKRWLTEKRKVGGSTRPLTTV